MSSYDDILDHMNAIEEGREFKEKPIGPPRESKPGHTPEPKEICRDCEVEPGEDCVTLCPLHAAAPRILALLKELLPVEGVDCDVCGVDSQYGPGHDGDAPGALLAAVEAVEGKP